MMQSYSTVIDADGLLRIVAWGQEIAAGVVAVDTGRLPHQMAHSVATGQGLVSNGELGVDMIRLGAGEGFAPHTHPGDHLLIVVAGEGTITYEGRVYPTKAGQVYMVEGRLPHAVGAITDHVILAVGSPHRPVDAPDRMTPVAYQSVLAEVGSLHCLICELVAEESSFLHDKGCPHCPCYTCVGNAA